MILKNARGAWFQVVSSLALLCGSAAADSAGNPTSRVPDGVSASDWSGIRAAYDARRHAVTAVADGFAARNPGQRWRTHFDGRGFTVTPEAPGARQAGALGVGLDAGTSAAWSWGLELVSYGREGAERPVSGPSLITADGQRLEYAWDESLTEWYINDRRGLEHGYTLHERPSGAGELRLTLLVRGELCPQISGDGRSAAFLCAAGHAALNYSGLTVCDADGNRLTALFEVSSRVDSFLILVVQDSGARYPITVDPIAQQAYLKASNTGANDWFGTSVAISGNTIVVGAPNEDSSAVGVDGDQTNNSASGAGAAYVFVRDGAAWSQQAYLKASNTDADDTFGWSVAVSGDTIVVGAYNEDSNATGVNGNQGNNSVPESGAAYVFTRIGSTWSQQAYLKASNTAIAGWFGYAVAVSADTVAVGSWGESDAAQQAGAAYVFVRNGTAWHQEAYLQASNAEIGDNFGHSIAISGNAVVVGAPQEDSSATGADGNQADNSAPGSGAAYVFVRSGTSWSQQAYLKASNTGAFDLFGWSIAISGDAVVVGAPLEDSAATGINGNGSNESAEESGAAYVFARNGGSWTEEAYLKASNTGQNDRFGIAVSIAGDQAAAGAFFEPSGATGVNGDQADNSAGQAGAAYLFSRVRGAWQQEAYLKASNTGTSDQFGLSVAISLDSLVVGAQGEDSNATGVNGNQANNSAPTAGSAYVFADLEPACPADLSDDGVIDQADLALLLSCYNAPNDPCGDIDGDGQTGQADLAALLAVYNTACP